jgi:DNA-directed RNA polymerase subunit RPC12/RpoP
MTFKPAKCPNCAGDLQVPEDRDSVKCMYCGSDIVVREAIKLAGGINVDNLLKLAKDAQASEMISEAYDYFTKVLEYDSSNVDAWIGKGITKTLSIEGLNAEDKNIYVRQLELCLNNAIKLFDNEDLIKKKIINILEQEIIKFNYLNGSIKSMYKLNNAAIFASNILKIDPNNLLSLIILSQHRAFKDDRIISKALEMTKSIPSLRDKLIKIIMLDELTFLWAAQEEQNSLKIVKAILNGLDGEERALVQKDAVKKLNDFLEGHSPDGPYSPYKGVFKIRDRYINEIKAIDKNYEPYIRPTSTEGSKKCFIVTAAYGSPLASEVILLKQFRDEHLSPSQWGQRLIALYYRSSPPIAAFIDKSELFRKVARACLAPIIFLIRSLKREADQP